MTDAATPAPGKLAPLLAQARALGPPLPCAVVHPVDAASLGGAVAAAAAGLIAPILVGPAARIRAAAAAAGCDIAAMPLVDTPHSHAAADQAIALVREGQAGALLKGALQPRQPHPWDRCGQPAQ